MKIAVTGEGHLADATRHECALHFEITGALEADLVWFCMDTPVDEQDNSDVGAVLADLRAVLRYVQPGTPALISSQLPVGTCAKWEKEFPEHHLAVQPENVRKAHAVADFHCQSRIVVGTRHDEDRDLIRSVVSKFCPDPNGVLFMSPESAEMVKHALNSFLALEIAYANEIADLCHSVHADVADVFRGFRSDRRVGDGPLNPGGPYRGGTLGRDVQALVERSTVDYDTDMSYGQRLINPLIRAIQKSNRLRL